LILELAEVFPFAEIGLLLAAPLYLAGARHSLLAALLCVFAGMVVGRHVAYAAALRRNLYPLAYIEYFEVGAVLYSLALVESWWQSTRGRVYWKGRAYAARTP
jgi:hypothetical protein